MNTFTHSLTTHFTTLNKLLIFNELDLPNKELLLAAFYHCQRLVTGVVYVKCYYLPWKCDVMCSINKWETVLIQKYIDESKNLFLNKEYISARMYVIAQLIVHQEPARRFHSNMVLKRILFKFLREHPSSNLMTLLQTIPDWLTLTNFSLMEQAKQNCVDPSKINKNACEVCMSDAKQTCDHCRVPRYCSSICHAHDWPKHKLICSFIKDQCILLLDHLFYVKKKNLC